MPIDIISIKEEYVPAAVDENGLLYDLHITVVAIGKPIINNITATINFTP